MEQAKSEKNELRPLTRPLTFGLNPRWSSQDTRMGLKLRSKCLPISLNEATGITCALAYLKRMVAG